LAAGIAGIVGIGSETFAPAVHEPEVLGLLEMLLALVPMFAPHAFESVQLVGSLHAVAALYAPVALFQLSIVPDALKLWSANAASVNPGIGHEELARARDGTASEAIATTNTGMRNVMLGS
jgi:hypothetical protein